jgi:hypothetical protein
MNEPELTEKDKDDLAHMPDKLWRMENLYKVRTKPDKNGQTKIIPFKFNFIQKILAKKALLKNIIRHFTLKARQEGVSTFWLIWWMDDAMFNDNMNIGVLAHKWDSLETLMGIMRDVYNNMDERFKPLDAEITGTQIRFPSKKSKIFISLEIRTATLSALHVSEWCHCMPERIKSSMGATSQNTPITGESTGNGTGDDGYVTYQQAKQGINGYDHSFFPLFIQQEYRIELNGIDRDYIMNNLKKEERRILKVAKQDWDIDITAEQILWYRQQKSIYKDMMQQEHPSDDEEAFIKSGHSYFDGRKIMALMKEATEYEKEHGFAETEDDYIMFHKPERYHIYALGADPADGGNPSTFKIIDVTDRKEVFKFRARCGLDYYYKMIDKYGRLYNDALSGIEDNNHGHAVLLGLKEVCNYPNLYRRVQSTRLKIDSKKKVKLGWHTGEGTRDLMLDQLRFAVEGDSQEDVDHFMPEYTIYDIEFLRECLTFIEIHGKYQAGEEYTDDLIFASGIGYQMYKILLPRTKKPHKSIGITINAETQYKS